MSETLVIDFTSETRRNGVASVISKHSIGNKSFLERDKKPEKAFNMKLAAMVFLMGLVCSAVALSIETKEYQEADREAAPREGSLANSTEICSTYLHTLQLNLRLVMYFHKQPLFRYYSM